MPGGLKSECRCRLDWIFKDMIDTRFKGEPHVEIIPGKHNEVADIRFSSERGSESANYIFPVLSIEIRPCIH